ncbi:hypothetical protein SAMN04489761_4042 [Tenacibaculum sp. MAR_2009_124]|uniref:DUF493 family protein n=1 Tax=Tenacibaculum sp. MAR_2009_124 TaxID=1250059 RepID=UPI00089D2FD7|nr:DUF493 family protein [Tenacibaculum sp. MAR_2009_124]SEC94391.1 hypothetical protein SAMN04489761_4042 [Tenacibaculum sp. MAR_2009_124]
MADKEEFYNKLKIQLEDTTTFPSKYLYKFIVPTTGNQVQEVQDLFNNGGAVINTKKSRTGKYISVSVQITVKSADDVIKYYRKAEVIEGIISL